MGKRSVTAGVLISGLILSLMVIGCHGTIKSTEQTPGITYHVTKDAQINKISMYMKESQGTDRCWVDVTVKNLTETSQKFKVIVQVDDEPEIAVTSKKPIDPKKEGIISVNALIKHFPRTVSLTVTN